MIHTPLALIVAYDSHRLIGRDGDLPWRLPNDLRHFKALTLGQTVLMGRKTWDSLPRRPLPERDNRVLTRDPAWRAQGAQAFTDFASAIADPRQGGVFVIGGAALYKLCLPHVQRLYVTEVHAKLAGDTYFPAFDADRFVEMSREDHPADERHAYAYSFVCLERRNTSATV